MKNRLLSLQEAKIDAKIILQHLVDAAEVPMPTSICSSLRDIVNLLSLGKVPSDISKYLAGGSLTAIVKD